MNKNYKKLSNGLIKQLEIGKQKSYDISYIKERYDSYKISSVNMSYLRLGYLLGTIKTNIKTLLDVGYGNGDFLTTAKKSIKNCYGNEVNSYNIPDGCVFVDDIYKDSYDVVCFFDVLEHFNNIYDIKNLKTNYIYISVPECHYFSDEWFYNWKHRREDEHLWHFNLNSLTNFMEEIGYKLVAHSNIEDIIRIPIDNNSNILTAIFERK